MSIDALKEKWDGIYAWNVKGDKVEPPIGNWEEKDANN